MNAKLNSQWIAVIGIFIILIGLAILQLVILESNNSKLATAKNNELYYKNQLKNLQEYLINLGSIRWKYSNKSLKSTIVRDSTEIESAINDLCQIKKPLYIWISETFCKDCVEKVISEIVTQFTINNLPIKNIVILGVFGSYRDLKLSIRKIDKRILFFRVDPKDPFFDINDLKNPAIFCVNDKYEINHLQIIGIEQIDYIKYYVSNYGKVY